jgi:glycosyltransferase involved in cell wall biosynthesis
MIIAINLTRNATAIGPYNFLIDCCTHIAQAKSNYFFVFISNQTIELPKSLPNIQCIILPQKFSNSISTAYWYNYTLPAAIKKCKANVLLHIDGAAALKINIPQYIFANEIESNSATLYTSNFIKKKQALFFNKVAAIFVQTSISKTYIQQKFGLDANKIHVVLPGFNKQFVATSWQQQQAIKEQFTNGLDYFLHTSNLTETAVVINVLKAFTQFKKRQKSNMKLVLLANKIAKNNEVINSLSQYKYRADVVVLIDKKDEVVCGLTAAAYACIQTEPHQNNFAAYLNIMQCKVPLIVAENIHTMEILQQATLYVNPTDVQAIAQAMMLVFTNEDKRNQCIQAASTFSNEYSWHKMAATFWQHLVATVNY